jgi:hypothetical protein
MNHQQNNNFLRELKQVFWRTLGARWFWIWILIVAALAVICALLFPITNRAPM